MYINMANPLLLQWLLYTDKVLGVLSKAHSLQSSCELDDDIMTENVLIIHLVLSFLSFSKNTKSSPNISRYGPKVRTCRAFTVLFTGHNGWPPSEKSRAKLGSELLFLK